MEKERLHINLENGMKDNGLKMLFTVMESEGLHLRNCFDTRSWSEGDYNGAFKNGLRDGDGAMVFKNGDVYEGQVVLYF